LKPLTSTWSCSLVNRTDREKSLRSTESTSTESIRAIRLGIAVVLLLLGGGLLDRASGDRPPLDVLVEVGVELFARLVALERSRPGDFVGGHRNRLTLHSQPSSRPSVAVSSRYSRNPDTPSGETTPASARAASTDAGSRVSNNRRSSFWPASWSAVETRARTVNQTWVEPTPNPAPVWNGSPGNTSSDGGVGLVFMNPYTCNPSTITVRGCRLSTIAACASASVQVAADTYATPNDVLRGARVRAWRYQLLRAVTIGSDSDPTPITPNGLYDCRQCSTARFRLTPTTRAGGGSGAGVSVV